MDGKMDGWMGGWVDGGMGGRMDWCINRKRGVESLGDGWIEKEQVDGWVCGRDERSMGRKVVVQRVDRRRDGEAIRSMPASRNGGWMAGGWVDTWVGGWMGDGRGEGRREGGREGNRQ